MKRLGVFLSVALIAVISLGGCAPEFEKPSLEDMAMIGVIGFDYTGDQDVKVSVSIPVPSSRDKEMTQTYAINASVTSEAMLMLSTMAERTMSLSQLRVILFSEEYARKVGISRVLLDLYRNPIVGENVFVAIVKGRAEDVIRGDYKHKPELNTYLNNLLRPRVETAFTSFASIKDFVYMMTSEVCDPNLPYLVKRGEDVEVARVALFRGDKMIDFMSQREGKMVQAMVGRSRLPRMSFSFPKQEKKGAKIDVVTAEESSEQKEEQIVLDFVWAKGRVRSNGSLTNPLIRIRLEMRASLVGYTGTKDLEKKEQFDALKTQLEAQIKKEAIEMLERLQKAGIDPAQLEESLRQKYHGDWNRTVGLKLYQKADFDVQVSMEIIGFGTMD
ncbi:MAG: spore gernimation protein [Brevibacillus sp.]|nr:spore gernimation protein [Brevibacillus sp.]